MVEQHQIMLKQAVKFFKEEQGFHRLLKQFIEKYQSLGRIGGSAKLQNLTECEKEALSVLFRKDYDGQISATIRLEDFAKALEKTKYAGVDIKKFLEAFAGRTLITKAEEQDKYQTLKEKFFIQLADNYNHPYCRLWLKHIEDKGGGTRAIHMAYDRQRELLKSQLENVLKAIIQLPKYQQNGVRAYQRISSFAVNITGDPHGFDLDTEQGRFFVAALKFIRKKEDEDYNFVSNLSAEELTELYAYFGLARDDILNFVTCAGIMGYDKDSAPLVLWKNACNQGVVMNVPLRELVKLRRFSPACTPAGKEKAVFVVENSGVFSSLMDSFQQGFTPPLICTHGQFKLAGWLLLDNLVKNGASIYYSGDFDPEGLQMAQRLIMRYPQKVILWRYHPSDYKKCISEVTIGKSRLKKLETIKVAELLPLVELIIHSHKAGYQEYLINDYIEDINKFFSL
ncbi:TIGR02679 family protein [Desulfofalx alkaliphila]|uniref:TIGR02679 family protein n=1 Tax=Desulfofalx alkaliphila TaxID=105483 RepID=UPI0006895401|nr:TIGR02679 family protein [Desulfofalx alkaliphila]